MAKPCIALGIAFQSPSVEYITEGIGAAPRNMGNMLATAATKCTSIVSSAPMILLVVKILLVSKIDFCAIASSCRLQGQAI